MKIMVGFLLNTFIVFTEPSNRSERRQKLKIGYVRRK